MNRSIRTLLTIAVSYATFVGAVFFSMKSEASVEEISNTQFVAAKCGEAVTAEGSAIAISAVCMGDLLGRPSANQMSAVQFTSEDGSSAVFEVKDVANLYIKLLSGAVRSNVIMVGPQGEEATMKIVRFADGSIRNAVGKLGETSFQVPQFE
ncbi:MAG: hypothetical protein J0L82_15635 [Deltaproteobacteria bacterium]|nr:hypothetical protein [Deltaproteobacteria bacterium]